MEGIIFSKSPKHSVFEPAAAGKTTSIQDVMRNSRKKTASKMPSNFQHGNHAILSPTPKKDNTLRRTKQY